MVATILLLSFMVALICCQPTTFTYNFNPDRQYSPSFAIGLIYAGSSVHIKATTASGPNSFLITSLSMQVATETVPQTAVLCNGGCLSNSCTWSCDIMINSNYRVYF